MIKRILFYTTIIGLTVFISTAFKPQKYTSFYQKNVENYYSLPSQNTHDYFQNSIPFTGKFFVGFKEAIAFKESQGKYNKVNTFGYLGKYQFGKTTLESVGIKDSLEFLNNPKLQEKAFVTLMQKNKWQLQKIIKQYEGKTIDNVLITESGILAAAHLGGVGSVKKFLQSNGTKKCKDKFGTSVKTYMKQFGGYETHNIVAKKNAKV